jgi:beta-lactamase class A
VPSIANLAHFIVHSLYRPLVLILLAITVTGCVPPPEAQGPRPGRPPATQARPNYPRPTAPRPTPAPPITQMPTTPRPVDFAARPPAALVESIKSLGNDFKGRVGIAVARSDSNWVVDHQGTSLFPQHSVSKLWVALTLADAIDKGQLRMSDPITLTKDDLTLFHQPIKQLIGDDGYQTTISDLFYRAMTQSDNTANDALLRRVGGPAAVRAFIASKGLGNIRFGPGERLFQSAIAGITWRQEYSQGRTFEAARNKLPIEERGQAMIRYLNDPMDGAAPSAVAAALAKLQRGELLSQTMTRTILSVMESAKTGKQRVAGGVPVGWTYGHKTGTGQVLEGLVTGYNDVGILTAPDGTAYTLAVLIRSTREGIRERQALMQSVAAAIAANHRR